MIPKIIHYCWLSDDPFPMSIVRCIESWKRFMPYYEFKKWDLQLFSLEKSEWVRQAYEAKKYAFAADYIRLYALYTEGGIYLDCDVEVLKSFDNLLRLPYFICKENSPQGVEAATIGAEKGCPWIGKCLNYYEKRSFLGETGKQDMQVLPSIIVKTLNNFYEIKYVSGIEYFDPSPRVVCILPSDFFSPKSYVSKRIKKTEHTYSIHHFAGTWQPRWKKMLLIIWVPFCAIFPNISHKLKSLYK